MKITIITIGKPSSKHISELIDDYQKRVKFNIEWAVIPHQTKINQPELIIKQESDLIIKKLELKRGDYKILLDESGKIINSNELAKIIDDSANNSLNLIFIIGGAYGVSEELKKKVDFMWSLSKLVFPHQIVRLILTEQIYRAVSINKGSSYHHE
jgi:23S rRNA (pseudouridine1915-N3)-methyltransferase